MDWSEDMKLKIRKMSELDAFKILFWQYSPPYDWYNLEGCEECLEELLYDEYYSVLNQKEQLIGFFCFGQSAQVSAGKMEGFYRDHEYLDIGLGMNPLLCGKGHGASFVHVGMAYAKNHFKAKKLRLTVADFNQRALKTYQKVGFKEIGEFNSQNIKFKVMSYED